MYPQNVTSGVQTKTVSARSTGSIVLYFTLKMVAVGTARDSMVSWVRWQVITPKICCPPLNQRSLATCLYVFTAEMPLPRNIVEM